MNFLALKSISKSFGKTKVLSNISISMDKGEFICLLGPSGCGKTTLLRIIAGLEREHGGEIYINNNNATKLPPQKRNFGIVFQSYALFPNMNVYKNIAFGLENKKMNKDQIYNKVREILDMVELKDCEYKYPAQLSGGQAQRVALARALALAPDFLLLDEPLSALDAKVREKLREEIKRIQKKLGITTIMVTHDQEEALSMADKIVVMNEGEVMQVGKPEEIYNYPNNAFVADFIGAINFIEDRNSGSITAIRPEDIKIIDESVKGTLKGIINRLEYRGAYYIVYINYNNLKLKINMPSMFVQDKKLREGCVVNFELGEGRSLEMAHGIA